MLFEWDENKRKQNIAKHDVDFGAIENFGWTEAHIKLDERKIYNEDRFIATGYIGDRLHACVWTIRNDVIRLISLRKANRREEQIHEEETETLDE